MKVSRGCYSLVLCIASLSLLLVTADNGTSILLSEQLRQAVTVSRIMEHLEQLQEIALQHSNTRVSGGPGFDASVQYVMAMLQEAGYQSVALQEFDFALFSVSPDPNHVLRQIEPSFVTYKDFIPLWHTDPGNVTASVMDVNATGCDPGDFVDFATGSIALILKGNCTDQTKAMNAAMAGASGVLLVESLDESFINNNDLGSNYTGGIPVFCISQIVGTELASTDGVVINMVADVSRQFISSTNLIAETTTGRDDRVIVVGAHLDSAATGPGINDNGSGSAAVLEIALQIQELSVEPNNKIRFIWFGGEEFGLHGSRAYVESLTPTQLDSIALMLNFDMVGSPNYVRFVYESNCTLNPESNTTYFPPGSDEIEKVFVNYFQQQGLPVDLTCMPLMSSDYYSFIDAGIPASGVFSGAGVIKTERQQAVYGGAAGKPYDECYHQACDDINNINASVLGELGDAAAHAVMTFATKEYPQQENNSNSTPQQENNSNSTNSTTSSGIQSNGISPLIVGVALVTSFTTCFV